MLSDTILQQIVERIANALKPDTIWLYGSLAYGRPHPNSDIDLLVIVPDTHSPYREAVKAYAALRGTCLPVEIKVVTRSQYAKRSLWKSSIEHEVQEKGKLLYAT
jgi:predicted nucleotidyltransferase